MSLSIADAHALEASWYCDPAIYERERHAIFAREWQVVGYESDLARPGDYVAAEFAGWRVFVIRARDGGVRGFHNVCRHRAGPLVGEGRGHCDVLRCRYHGWLYDTDGNLRKAVDFGAAEDFDPGDFSLFPVRAGIWRGLVFVNLDPGAPDLLDDLGGFAEEGGVFAIEDYRFHRTFRHDLPVNWKTYSDNYLEGYHVPFVHPILDAEVERGSYEVLVRDGGYNVQRARMRDGANNSGLWLWRFPNLGVNVYAEGLSVERILPMGARATAVVIDTFFHKDLAADAPEIADAVRVSQQTTLEDVEICKIVQRNLESGVYTPGRLSPKNETGVFQFQCLVRAALERAPLA